METIKKYVRAVSVMVMAGWSFEIEKNDSGIAPVNDAEFIKQTIRDDTELGEVFVKPGTKKEALA